MTGSSLCPAPRYNGEVGDIVVGRITEVKLGFPDVPWRRRAARCLAGRVSGPSGALLGFLQAP